MPRPSAVSLREYWMSTSLRSVASRSIISPFLSSSISRSYFSGEPRPKMQDTLATTIVSRRPNSDAVAAWRRRSISSLIEVSFSMYRSCAATYASGW